MFQVGSSELGVRSETTPNSEFRIPNSKGVVYLVGAGPGDPGLMTIKGERLLEKADVVVYDHLVSPRILRACRSDAKRIYVGKEASRHALSQDRINALLVRMAKSNNVVVRLKGGDPFLFGRGGEEALVLSKAGVAFEIVPGVTSAIAVPAYAGIPVTQRRLASSVAMITGHEDPEKSNSSIRWQHLATGTDTLVFLMGMSTLSAITTQLLRNNRPGKTPCAVIERGTLQRQRTVTASLDTIVSRVKRSGIRPPAVFVVGDVVTLRSRLAWFERKPLFGKRLIVTRSSDKAASLTEQLEALGAHVDEIPAIELKPLKDNGPFRKILNQIPDSDWVFFTSPEGIGFFMRTLRALSKDIRCLSGCHIGAIGPKTAAAIEGTGLHVDFLPKAFSQEGMLRDFPKRLVRGKRAFIFSAEGSRDVLEEGLRKRGILVTKVPIYRTVMPNDMARRSREIFGIPCDYVTVTSESCVSHLATALKMAGIGDIFRKLCFASIGPITSEAVRTHGGKVTVEARISTIEGLTDALRKRGRKR